MADNSITQNKKEWKVLVDPREIRNYSLAQQLLASQEELCPIDLVVSRLNKLRKRELRS